VLFQFNELLLSITAFPCPFLAETQPCLFVLLLFIYVLAFVQARGKYNEWTGLWLGQKRDMEAWEMSNFSYVFSKI